MTFVAVFAAPTWGIAAVDEGGYSMDFSPPTPTAERVSGSVNKLVPFGECAWLARSGPAEIATIVAAAAPDLGDSGELAGAMALARPAVERFWRDLPAADRRYFEAEPAHAFLLAVGVSRENGRGWMAELNWRSGAVRERTGEVAIAAPPGIDPGDLTPTLRSLERHLGACDSPSAAASLLGRYYNYCRGRWPDAAMGGALHFGTIEPGRRGRLESWPDTTTEGS